MVPIATHAATAGSREIFDRLPSIHWLTCAGGADAWFNKAFYTFTGRPSISAMTDFFGLLEPEFAFDKWPQGITSGKHFDFEFRLAGPSGERHWFNADCLPVFDGQGQLHHWIATCQNVNATKLAERRLSALLDAIPQLVLIADPAGEVIHVNQNTVLYSGRAERTLHGAGLELLLHPDDELSLPAVYEQARIHGTSTQWTARLRRIDGVYRAHLGNCAPLFDRSGEIDGWVLTFTDIDDQVNERESLRELTDTIPQFVGIACPDGTLDYANAQFLAYTGLDLMAPDFVWSSIVHPGEQAAIRHFWAAIRPTPEPAELEIRIRRSDGVYRWHLLRFSAALDAQGAVSRWYLTATDIHNARRTTDVLRYLDEAGEILNVARNLDKALENAVKLAVPRVADWCAIYLRQENGTFIPAAIHHNNATLVEVAHEMLRRYPFSDATQRELLQTRAAIFYPDISPASLRDGAVDSRHAYMLSQLEIASAIVVPLLVGEEVIGMLHLVRGSTSERFVSADVDFAKILGKRFAVAIDNSASYERERNVANTFQRAALPRALPELAGVELDAIYVAGAREAEIGGDWYDALTLPDGTLLISIGDVAGKGLDAAVLMGSMRQAIRVTGLQGLSPAAILSATQAALRMEQPGRFVTAFVATLAPNRRTLTYASAGHPAPIIREGDQVRFLELGGPPLGIAPYEILDFVTELQAPWLMTAYTDGLIEITADIIGGEQSIVNIMRDDGVVHAAHAATYIRKRILTDAVRDDTAILTIAVDPAKRWRFSANDAMSAEYSRAGFVAWLRDHTAVELQAAELIYGELIGNVVRHSPGPIDVDVVVEDRNVWLYVQDYGDHFDVAATLPADILAESGRGLFIASMLGENLHARALPISGKQLGIILPQLTT